MHMALPDIQTEKEQGGERRKEGRNLSIHRILILVIYEDEKNDFNNRNKKI